MERLEKLSADELIAELTRLQISGEYFFRGTNTVSQMNSSLIRKYTKNVVDKNAMTVDQYEDELLGSYGKYEGTYVKNVNSVVDWVASAQHYGLPTRFIDWTRNPFCALFFALYYKSDKKDENDYKVWVVNQKKVNYFENIPNVECNCDPGYRRDFTNYMLNLFKNLRNTLNSPIACYSSSQEGQALCSFYEQMNKKKCLPIFFSTNYSNFRLVVQQGLFQWDSGYPFDEGKAKYIEKVFVISSDEREKILVILDNMGVNVPKLFPELDSVCRYLGEKQYLVNEEGKLADKLL